MNDYDLRPCPFCDHPFTTHQTLDGLWQLQHDNGRCILVNTLIMRLRWLTRDDLVAEVNHRPTEERLRNALRLLNDDLWRQREYNRALKAIKEVQNSRRWWKFWR